MKKVLYLCFAISFSLFGCNPTSSTDSPSAAEATNVVEAASPTVQPSQTPPPAQPTNTPQPTPTSLPGNEIIPLSQLGNSIPWLPLDETQRPMTIFLAFNLDKTPFDDPMVRKAFAAATDREAIVEFVANYFFEDSTPATTLIPSSVLGRDLNGEVGIPFDPDQARSYLAQAGYTEGENFPEIRILTYQRGEAAPSTYYRLVSDIIAPTWQEVLGVTVKVDSFPQRIMQLPQKIEQSQPDLYIVGWGADLADPDNIFQSLVYSGADWNLNGFSNPEFDDLINQAVGINSAEDRQLLYIHAERILCEQEVAILPLFHGTFYFGN